VTVWKTGEALPPISLDLTLRRAIQAVAGTRDYYPFHHDEQFARENGADGIFFNTMFLQAFAGRAATSGSATTPSCGGWKWRCGVERRWHADRRRGVRMAGGRWWTDCTLGTEDATTA
jgi:hypothetical protein